MWFNYIAMSRDYRKLRVFVIADELAVDAYRFTAGFPSSEKYGLQSQLRRAAVSIASNIVEGSARHSVQEYCHFLNIANASAWEARYLTDLAFRLGLLEADGHRSLTAGYCELVAGLQTLLRVMKARSANPQHSP